jgi:hypothetical protein
VHEGKIRTIIRDKRFEQEMATIERNVRRADEFMEGAETILSRQPESGFPLEQTNVWFIAGHTVDLALYYTFDENNVYLLSIQKVIPPEL